MSQHNKLILSRVGFAYEKGDRNVLEGIDLEVDRGERVALLGESGSGKSTLLGLFSGMLAPTVGKVLLADRDLSTIAPQDRRFALVLQQPPVLAGVTVAELLQRPARRDGGSPHKMVTEALERLGMKGLHNRKLSELSGGQRQRVHLARTLVWKPDFMLLDEPFNSIDVQSKHSIYPVIRRHQMDSGSAMILVTHDAQEAFLFCERIVVVRDGRVLADVSAEQLRTAPPNIPSARLLTGFATNFIEVESEPQSNSTILFRSCLAPFAGTFQGVNAQVECPRAAIAMINWGDIVSTLADSCPSCPSTVFTSLHASSDYASSPVLYFHEGRSVYGRAAAPTSGGVRLRTEAHSIFLYHKTTEELIGTVGLQLSGRPGIERSRLAMPDAGG